MTVSESDPFDFSPKGEVWWRHQQGLTKASEQQLRFAVSFSRGGNATESARLAGYSGDSEALRQAGYSAKRSAAVQSLLAQVAAEVGGEGPATRDELKMMYSGIVRAPGASPSDKVRAGEALMRLDAADREERARTETPSPAAVLEKIRELNPRVADILAEAFGIELPGKKEAA